MHDDDTCGKALFAVQCDLAPGHSGACHTSGDLTEDEFTVAKIVMGEMAQAIKRAERAERENTRARWLFYVGAALYFVLLGFEVVTGLADPEADPGVITTAVISACLGALAVLGFNLWRSRRPNVSPGLGEQTPKGTE